jgi:hypothetical protein
MQTKTAAAASTSADKLRSLPDCVDDRAASSSKLRSSSEVPWLTQARETMQNASLENRFNPRALVIYSCSTMRLRATGAAAAAGAAAVVGLPSLSHSASRAF